MNCPNCGKQSSLDQKFCRSCGMNLEPISKAVSDHLFENDAGQLKPQAGEGLILRQMYRWLCWGFIAVVFGVLLIIIGKQNDWITLPGILMSLMGIVAAVYGILLPIKAKAFASRPSSGAETLRQSTSGLSLPPKSFSEPVPSVTERTTDLLPVTNSSSSEK